MVTGIMIGVLAAVAFGFGVIGRLEFRALTTTQRGEAPLLMALKLGFAVLLCVLGVAALVGVALGAGDAVFEASLLLALSTVLYVVVDRWLLAKLDGQHGPLEELWLEWWELPADR